MDCIFNLLKEWYIFTNKDENLGEKDICLKQLFPRKKNIYSHKPLN